ncbi:MAG: L-aspartate oxidase [Candidatus Delongbacteria bacterium]|nr:L-aspartate oxidase [Candidatus Cloacimonadota bacterium]MCB9474827.1 L-aspartate oxidase [Candidatus Delongbacteria bacterium]
MNRIDCPVLILGCGIAGSTAALQLADAGIRVTVVTRASLPEESNTYHAQGGIIYEGDDDSPELLQEDLLRAGDGVNNPLAARLLAEEGPRRVRQVLIDRVGVPFDRGPDGDLARIREAAHSSVRILHVGDSTGRSIEVALLNAIREHPNVTLLTRRTAVDLLTPAHHSLNPRDVYEPLSCCGAYVLDHASGRVDTILAATTVLATGGLGQVYLRTTNPEGSRGDGLAMANRAGARVVNCEYVQFHPTALYHDGKARFLISEAVRGAGAKLINRDGEAFMARHSPQWKDLAPRDEVARGIHREMIASGSTNVWLDLASALPAAEIRTRFPMIHKRCLEVGVDITSQPIPVVPAAHYFCGGVWTDLEGRTSIERLYAVGEVACTGLHGANRLGSASILEGLVWGCRVAEHIEARKDTPAPVEVADWEGPGENEPDPALVLQDMNSIRHMMWNYVSVVRTTPRLRRALRHLRTLETEIESFYRRSRISDTLIGLRNAVRSSVLITAAALANRKSMGCHYRE